jgi:hypothetical protein
MPVATLFSLVFWSHYPFWEHPLQCLPTMVLKWQCPSGAKSLFSLHIKKPPTGLKLNFFFLKILVILGVSPRALCLFWATLPVLFVLVIFEVRSHFILGWPGYSAPICASQHIWGWQYACHCTQPLVEIVSWELFCLGWPRTNTSLNLCLPST